LTLRKTGIHHKAIITVLFIALCAAAGALDFSLGTFGTYSTESRNAMYVEGYFGLNHVSDTFSISGEVFAESEGTYPEPFLADFFGPFSLGMRNAGFSYKVGSLSLYLGKLPLQDEIDSPYSLFLSGAKPSAMTGGMDYEYKNFYFSNRWIGLDKDTEPGLYQTTETAIYRNRGAVFKSYSYDFGRLLVGFQDATIFTDAYFDVDIFALPLPSALVQPVLTASGRPGARSGDQNSIMGFFGRYDADGFSLHAQLLVDDFNMNRFLNPSAYKNPDKLAWTFGSRIPLPLGTLGLFTAGATKYTFESVREEFYSYTLHAGSAVLSDSTVTAVPLEDQMLGYINGENNLALMARWEAPISGMNLNTGLEFRLTGAQSPTNPWHNGEAWSVLGTQLLNDPVLETRILWDFKLSRKIDRFTLFAQAKAGYVFNRLNPVYPGSPGYSVITEPDGDMQEPLFIPTSGDSGLIAQLSLGGSWSLGL
jgi:hypothetical protein